MNRIIDILKTIDRPGIDRVIEFMEENNYKGSRCYGHHKYAGGLVDHSLEVYNHMMQNCGELPKDSIIVCAFFHDLGKASKSTRQIKDHEGRSVRLLDKCGFPLTAQERNAILTHHQIKGYLNEPLRKCLSQADIDSTGRWKEANDPNYNSSLSNILKNIGLKFISKL